MKKFLYAAHTALKVIDFGKVVQFGQIIQRNLMEVKKIIIWQFFFLNVEVPSSDNYFMVFLVVTYENMTIEF